MTTVFPKCKPCKPLPGLDGPRQAAPRYRPNQAAKKLASRYGLSVFTASAIARANGFGPQDDC